MTKQYNGLKGGVERKTKQMFFTLVIQMAGVLIDNSLIVKQIYTLIKIMKCYTNNYNLPI